GEVDHVARVVEEVCEGLLSWELEVAPRVRDIPRAPGDRRLYCHGEVRIPSVRGIDQRDVAPRANRGDHVEVERLLQCPPRPGAGQWAALASLVENVQAAVRPRARGQVEELPVHLQVCFGMRVVEGVNDGHDPAPAGGGGFLRELVGSAQVRRVVPRRGRGPISSPPGGHATRSRVWCVLLSLYVLT